MATNENEGGYVVPSVFMYGGEITKRVNRPGLFYRLVRALGFHGIGTKTITVKVEGILEKAKNAKIKRT